MLSRRVTVRVGDTWADQGIPMLNTHYLGQLNLIIVDNSSTYMSLKLQTIILFSLYRKVKIGIGKLNLDL